MDDRIETELRVASGMVVSFPYKLLCSQLKLSKYPLKLHHLKEGGEKREADHRNLQFDWFFS